MGRGRRIIVLVIARSVESAGAVVLLAATPATPPTVARKPGVAVTEPMANEFVGIDTLMVDPRGASHLWLDDIKISLRQ